VFFYKKKGSPPPGESEPIIYKTAITQLLSGTSYPDRFQTIPSKSPNLYQNLILALYCCILKISNVVLMENSNKIFNSFLSSGTAAAFNSSTKNERVVNWFELIDNGNVVEGRLENIDNIQSQASEIFHRLQLQNVNLHNKLQPFIEFNDVKDSDRLILYVLNDLINNKKCEDKLNFIRDFLKVKNALYDLKFLENKYQKCNLEVLAFKVFKVFDYKIVRLGVALCVTAVAIPILATPFVTAMLFLPFSLHIISYTSITTLFFLTVAVTSSYGAGCMAASSFFYLTGQSDNAYQILQECNKVYKLLYAPIFYSATVFKKTMAVTFLASKLSSEYFESQKNVLDGYIILASNHLIQFIRGLSGRPAVPAGA